MKRPAAHLVVPFSFTDQQKKDLLRCWKRIGDHERAVTFLESTRSILEVWLSLEKNDGRINAKKLKGSAANINSAAKSLIASLDELPYMVQAMLNMEITTRLNITEHQATDGVVLRDLKHLAGCATLDEYDVLKILFVKAVNAAYIPHAAHAAPDGYDLIEILEKLLGVLIAASAKPASIRLSPGQDKGREKLLIEWLVTAYGRDFNKLPKSTNGSIFRKFVAGISEILKRKLGAEIVNEVIKNRQH
jgi:hypothetical protein